MGLEQERWLWRLAVEQLGVVSYRQCQELGFTSRFLKRRVETGAWLRVHQGVYKLSGSKPTVEQREIAALLAAGEEAVLSHHSAARHHGLDIPKQATVHVTVPDYRTVSKLEGVRIWRSKYCSRKSADRKGRFIFTPLGRTVLDMAATLDDGWLRAVIDSSLRRSRYNLRWIVRTLASQGSGHHGAHRLRTLLAEVETRVEIPDSALESMAMSLAREFRVVPELHCPIVDWGGLVAEVDFAWPDAKVCVEFDGWKYHGTREAFSRDRARDRRLVRMGWSVLRFTWKDVIDYRERVVDEIREVLDNRLPAGDMHFG
jgi:hypothetical protein